MRKNVREILKATFTQMVKEDIIWGIKPLFKDDVDLEVHDVKMKSLILAYLRHDKDVYPNPISTNYDWEWELGDGEYPVRFPFVKRTFLDHWYENKHILKEPLFVKFVDFGGEKNTRKRKRIIKKELKEKGYDLSKILIVPLYGRIEENVGEFLSSLYFRYLGYISSCHLTPVTAVRQPDLTCWKTPLLKKLREYGLVDGGAIVYELQMLRVFGKIRSKPDNSNNFYESVVIEVESDKPSKGIDQLLGYWKNIDNYKIGYVKKGNYDKCFLVAPSIKDYDKRVGILSFSEEGIYFKESPLFETNENKDKSIREMDNLFKWLLLTNLTFDEILDIIKYNGKPVTFFHILKEINEINVEKILDKLEEVI